MRTEPPTSTETGAIWVTGQQINDIAACINERTVRINPRWSSIIVLTEKTDGLELEVDVEELLKSYGQDVYFVRDGVAVVGRFLIGADVREV